MSEHRRKPPPQPQGGGGRAAARRAAQQPTSGRRAAPPSSSATPPPGGGDQYGGRAGARRGAQRSAPGGRRRPGDAGSGGGRGRRDGGRPGKKRFIDYPRAGKDGVKRWLPSWKLVLGACFTFIGLILGTVGVALAVVQVPSEQKAAAVQKNVYYWSDGKQMVVAGGGALNRQIVPIAKIPKSMQYAVISAENASFYEDWGVDPMGIARAVVKMAQGGETQSGSTITQQFVKNTYLSQEQTLKRKATELLISIKVGATKDKDDILAGYLNTAYYGRGAYGIQAAARAYYDKDCTQLTASESAYLAATLNGPNLYDPYGGQGPAATPEKNTKRSMDRWKWTLDREVEVGHLKAAERDTWVAKGFPQPQKPKPATNRAGQIGYLTDLADNYIVAHSTISKNQLDRGGYQIHTTFDRDKVEALSKAVEDVRKANIKPDVREKDKFVQFGGASVEPKTGKIVAIYGGENALEHYTNNADYTGVQVGSTFKPFVLAAAMTHGKRDPGLGATQSDSQRTLVSPDSVYNGNNKLTLRNYNGSVWHDPSGSEWRQVNDGDEDRGLVTLRTAMQFSVNTPFIQLGMDVGTDKVKEAALAAGLDKDQLAATTPTFSLGTSAPSAIRLAGAYATFAASGKQMDPYSVEKVEKDGKPAYVHEASSKLAFSPRVANNVTDVLKTVVEAGTGTSAKLGDRPAAGKTGTTDGNRSAWFAGYTPQLSTAVGMYRVDPNAKKQEFLSMRGVGGQTTIHGASFPAEIWADYMGKALKGRPIEQFERAEPIGEKVFGDGASPSPSAVPSTAPSASPSKSPSASPSKPASPSPKPSKVCLPFDRRCHQGDNGGPGEPGTSGDPGGVGGPGGDPGTSPSPEQSRGRPGGGGLFGGMRD
ncbi:transglycosylase domain-containing protein [Streptomyces albireticuli]|uniref:Penicillin-binding protein n=1 Tax=Streptomyces albireticuli TaxID=1940 RepID=A0A2A2D834_9ACTN|nr:transglycosylase domain-containing protein [Streptomyces albireticuli]MCD9143763.1 penicillin-binding protein [Streptomyces albireticuli]MCD9161806.1 penicillin-binding protein [Streptomyces albireticuli]MCD9191880.1 penicillin-binding protein [Streptomyces albireticuli]PAU48638.1 penicillin-binding protein [Streptomyces albireticuli]